MKAVRILVVEDETLMRSLLVRVLRKDVHFEVVGEAVSGAEADRLVGKLRPDVVYLDIAIPEPNGLELTKRWLRTYPDMRILLVSGAHESETVRGVLFSGAHGYVDKEEPVERLVEALQEVSCGRNYYSSSLYGYINAAQSEKCLLKALSPREKEVLTELAQGSSVAESAGRLGISEHTVRTHRKNLMRKLGENDVVKLTRLAMEAGIA